MNEIVKQYLDEVGVVEINPVWGTSDMDYIVGYHLQNNGGKGLDGIMKKLKTIIYENNLGYSLSEFNPNTNQKTFIIFLNN